MDGWWNDFRAHERITKEKNAHKSNHKAAFSEFLWSRLCEIALFGERKSLTNGHQKKISYRATDEERYSSSKSNGVPVCRFLSGGQGEEDHVQEREEGEEDVLYQGWRALLVDRGEAGWPQRVRFHTQQPYRDTCCSRCYPVFSHAKCDQLISIKLPLSVLYYSLLHHLSQTQSCNAYKLNVLCVKDLSLCTFLSTSSQCLSPLRWQSTTAAIVSLKMESANTN